MSGGSAGGSTGGFHHAITIKEKSRAIANAKGSGGLHRKGFFSRHRAIVITIIIVALLALGAVIDGAITQDRIYAGVKVGALDLGGKTEAEAEALIMETYGAEVADARAVIFADANEAASHETGGVLSVKAAENQWESLVEQAGEGKLWLADAASLGLSLPADRLAADALAVGRQNGGFFTRAGSMFSGYEVPLEADLSPESFEALARAIEESTHEPWREYSVEVVDGQAKVVNGQNGYRVNREALRAELNNAIFASETAGVAIVAAPEYSEIATSDAQAATLAQKINDALGHGLAFTFRGTTIKPTRDDVGSWVSVSTVNPRTGESGKGDVLYASLNAEVADRFIAKGIHPTIRNDYTLQFVKEAGVIWAQPSAGAPLPEIPEAVASVNAGLFDLSVSAGEPDQALGEGASQSWPETVEVPIGTGTAPARLSFDEALDTALVTAISTYETEYQASNTNRVINIHLATDFLNNSIVAPGETWSFLETVGNPTADRGFVGAGVIIANEHQDDVGGGICQVATTIFNAVYEAGFPITRRYNHSLYMANYPDGRDAAVSYPDLDLQWKNDTSSGVLLHASYTDSSLTITLYGVDPGYEVTTEVGEWKEGKAFSQVTKIDPTIGAGYSYIETEGENGSSITVTRTVRDADGEIKDEDVFSSEYQPVDEVTISGGDDSDG